jgi:hypothetical protein
MCWQRCCCSQDAACICGNWHDALRRQRNLIDYEDDPISAAALQACVATAEKLLGHAGQWLHIHYPEWTLD